MFIFTVLCVELIRDEEDNELRRTMSSYPRLSQKWSGDEEEKQALMCESHLSQNIHELQFHNTFTIRVESK